MASKVWEVPTFVSCIYSPPVESDRKLIWNEIGQQAKGVNGSWLCIGDFNDLFSLAEKLGGNPHPIKRVLNFQIFATNYDLVDLEIKGS